MKRKSHSRGQAVYETAAVMPVFLIALFGVIWAMKDASLSERVHLAVRYGGMVSSQQQPYESYSLYAMYATIDNVVPTGATTCYAGNPAELSSGFASFWLPATSESMFATCPGSVVFVRSPETYSEPVILRNDYATIEAAAPVGGFLEGAVMHGVGATNVRAAENFFRSPDVGTLLTCTTLGAAVKKSLEGETDTSTAPPATPMPTSVPTATVVTGTTAACATPTFAPATAPY